MADVTIGGAIYNGVEQVDIPLASGGGKASFYLNGGSAFVPYNVNLLDNADWGAYVINQRGNTSYSGQYSYGIDRWIINGDIEVASPTDSAEGYITLSSGCTMKQRMEILPSVLAEKTVTAAIDIAGTVYSGSTRFPDGAGEHTLIDEAGVAVKVGIDSGTYTLCGVSSAGVPYIKVIASSNVSVRRVWLELGNVCHMNTTPPKNYAESLSICQRYYQRIPNSSVLNQITTWVTTTQPRSVLVLPVQMRTVPVVEVNTYNVLYNNAWNQLASSAVTVNGVDYIQITGSLNGQLGYATMAQIAINASAEL